MRIRNRNCFLSIGMAACLAVFFACPVTGRAADTTGSAHLVVTAKAKGSQTAPALRRSDIDVTVKGRPAKILSWKPLTGSDAELQLVFLFDESARSYLSQQIPTLTSFINSLPPHAAVGIAYMGNGVAVMSGPMTTDHAKAASYLRLTTGVPGISGSPYFCLSDLAEHWPSTEKTNRRVVFMVSSGADPYYPSTTDLQNPYVTNAIRDSQKAGLMVYTMYFANHGFGSGRASRILTGQSYLLKVSRETGAEAYSIGLSSPVSFEPFLKKFRESLDRQYGLTIATNGSGFQQIKVRSKVPGVSLAAPNEIYAGPKR